MKVLIDIPDGVYSDIMKEKVYDRSFLAKMIADGQRIVTMEFKLDHYIGTVITKDGTLCLLSTYEKGDKNDRL